MSEDKSQSAPAKKKKRLNIPVITRSVNFLKEYLYVFLIAGVFSALIHIAFFLFNPTGGWELTKNNLTTAQEQLGVERWVDLGELYQRSTDTLATEANEFANTRFMTKAFEFAESIQKRAATIENEILVTITMYISAVLKLIAMLAITWFLKVLILGSYIPAYLLICSVGILDGMVKRKIDTYKGKRDTEDQTEFWFRKFRIATVLILYAYFVIPSQFGLEKLIVISILLTAITTRMLTANFHKYW